MDIVTIKSLAIQLRSSLRECGIRADLILLYGSFARGLAHKDSDIDLAVVSRDYGVDRFEESIKLNLIATKINPMIEAVPIGLADYMRGDSISPLLEEIKGTGTPIL